MEFLINQVILLLLITCVIEQVTSEIDFNSTDINSILAGKGNNAFTFVSSYFYSDDVTICNACSECSSNVTNLFMSGDYCIKCQGNSRCDTEIINVKVDFDFDFAWIMTYQVIKSSKYSNEHDPVEFSLLASNDKQVWDELSTVSSVLYPQGRNEEKSFPLENKNPFQYYRVVLKKKKGVDSGNAPLRIGGYDISSIYTTQVMNELMLTLFQTSSFYPSTIDDGIEIKIGEVIKPSSQFIMSFSINPSIATLDYLSNIFLGTALDKPSVENSYNQYILWCGIDKDGHNLLTYFNSTLNFNIDSALTEMVPNQNNKIKFVAIGRKITIFINGLNQTIDSALPTQQPPPKLNFFWIRSESSSQLARVIMKNLVFTSIPDKHPDPEMHSSLISESTNHIPSLPPSELTYRNLAKQINILDIQGRKEVTSLLDENYDTTNDLNIIKDENMENAINATEDYFVDLSDFVTQDKSDPFSCKCVDCEEDKICGGLWKGDNYENIEYIDIKRKKIHIVISQCKGTLHWINDFVNGFDIASIHVFTKCGEPLSRIDPPSMATIEELPNVGRNDHTYAYFIANVLPNIVDENEVDDSIIVFLKDDISTNNLHQTGKWNNFEDLIRIASTENGFACGISADHVKFGQHKFLLSAYHELETLSDFAMEEYHRNTKEYIDDLVQFQSIYDTIGDWWHFINANAPSKLVQVCYGGAFASSVSNIRRTDIPVWKAIENSLSRGNNIQEGHYAERTWAALLSTPLQPFQIDALLYKSDGVYLNKNSMHGALMTRPQLYLHVGVFGTYSSELLSDSLIENESLLKLDGYNIAVHGKHGEGIHGFPNIDKFASCMWSNMTKSTFPDNQKEEIVCPNHLLPELTDYMKRTQRESHDLIILNPLLARPGTADSLGIFIDPLWHITTVIYYRRYFEWITIMFDHWREEFLHNSSFQETAFNAFRFIDFLRKYNNRLFYDKDGKEDSVGDLSVNNLDDIIHARKRQSLQVHADQFDFTPNLDIKDLTDHQEYTYFVAKQYNSVPRLREVIIVNSHDIRGPDVNFFCHVLDYTDNSCKAVIDNEKLFNETSEINNRNIMQTMNNASPFKLETALEDIALAAFSLNRLPANDIKTPKRKLEQIHLWIEMIRYALNERNVTAEDLPFECLDDFETLRLLEVSLAYEKSMLPMFFASPKGERHLRDTFSEWRFCSVNVNEIIEDPKWNFVFESVVNFTLPELP